MSKYSDQSLNNIVCLFEDVEYKERKEVFLRILKEFSERNVKWAVGCSMSLFLRGIVDEFHDLDLIVDKDSIETIKSIMNEIGAEFIATGGNGFCESDVYLHYQVGRVDVDFISGFKVMTFNTQYYYRYNGDELDWIKIEDFNVPVIATEAMYILYYMMEGWQPKRRFKRLLIEEYLRQQDLEHPEILRNAMNNEKNPLPGWIRWDLKKYFNNN